jgi:hypothetical protein
MNLGPFHTGGVRVNYTLPPGLYGARLIGASTPLTPVAGLAGPAFQVGTLTAGYRAVLTITAWISPTVPPVQAFTVTLTTTATALTPHPDALTRVDSVAVVLNVTRPVVYLPRVQR